MRVLLTRSFFTLGRQETIKIKKGDGNAKVRCWHLQKITDKLAEKKLKNESDPSFVQRRSAKNQGLLTKNGQNPAAQMIYNGLVYEALGISKHFIFSLP